MYHVLQKRICLGENVFKSEKKNLYIFWISRAAIIMFVSWVQEIYCRSADIFRAGFIIFESKIKNKKIVNGLLVSVRKVAAVAATVNSVVV